LSNQSYKGFIMNAYLRNQVAAVFLLLPVVTAMVALPTAATSQTAAPDLRSLHISSDGGLSAGAEQAWQAALQSAERGLLPGLAWRALAGLGRYPEALALLDTVPLGQTGLQAGELVAHFAPWLIERTVDDPEDGLELVEALADGIAGEEVSGLLVKVENALGEKCERCWTYSETVGQSDEHPAVCQRCRSAITTSEA
jgi:hypothetical protein